MVNERTDAKKALLVEMQLRLDRIVEELWVLRRLTTHQLDKSKQQALCPELLVTLNEWFIGSQHAVKFLIAEMDEWLAQSSARLELQPEQTSLEEHLARSSDRPKENETTTKDSTRSESSKIVSFKTKSNGE